MDPVYLAPLAAAATMLLWLLYSIPRPSGQTPPKRDSATTQLRLTNKLHSDLHQKHVFITGGSKGLGKALAFDCAVKFDAFVTVLARNERELQGVVEEISKSLVHGKIQYRVGDVTNEEVFRRALDSAVQVFGPVSVLFCAAGVASTGRLLDKSLDDFKSQINLNYLGSVGATLPVVRAMIQQRIEGRVVLIASQMAMVSFVGYAAYAPSKYAIRGFADSLRNEMLPYGIKTHLVLPGNMKTPGYEVEQETKPEETKKLEAGEPLQTPEEVSRATLDSMGKEEYQIYGGNLSGFLLGRIAAGMAPRSTLILDVIAAPLLVLAAWGVRTFEHDKLALGAKKKLTNEGKTD